MKTILHIVGNRPQFIKLAVLYNQLSKHSPLKQQIVHTGQHYSYNMSEVFFKELAIPVPDVNLKIANSSPEIFIKETTKALVSFLNNKNDAAVFVYGDTNTTLAAARAAKTTGLPLLHFEAGVRTYVNSMPEEINRIETDRLADVNYCCTGNNFITMQKEGLTQKRGASVVLSGDLMLDAFMQIPSSAKITIPHQQYVVCTIHRQANLCDPSKLKNIIDALNRLHQTIPVVMPLHPHTKLRIQDYGLVTDFTILTPLGYRDMKKLLQACEYIITDSGGTSREAYFLQKKSLIIMDHPFWPEIIEAKCSLHCGADENDIITKFEQLPALQPNFTGNLFGEGRAAINIQDHLINYFQ